MAGSFDFRVSRREGTEYSFLLPHPAANKARLAKAANKARLAKKIFFMEDHLFLPAAERGDLTPRKWAPRRRPYYYPPMAVMQTKKMWKVNFREGTRHSGSARW